MFDSGPPCSRGRVWGVVVEISGWFKKRRYLIQLSWNDYINNHLNDNDGDRGEHARRCTDMFNSGLFWCFIMLAHVFGPVLKCMNDWAVDCPCHQPDVCERLGIAYQKPR